VVARAVGLELVGDCGRQKVVQELLGARFLRSRLVARLVELPDRAVMLDQPATQLEQSENLARQAAQRFRLFEREPARLEIQDAQGSERITLVGDERHAAIESAVRIAHDQRGALKPPILRHVRHHQHLRAADRRRANRSRSRQVGHQ
jgi:hypothetical protein